MAEPCALLSGAPVEVLDADVGDLELLVGRSMAEPYTLLSGAPVEVLDANVGDLELLLPDARQLGGAKAQLAQQQLQRRTLVVAVPRRRVHVPAPRWATWSARVSGPRHGSVLICYHHETHGRRPHLNPHHELATGDCRDSLVRS